LGGIAGEREFELIFEKKDYFLRAKFKNPGAISLLIQII